MSRSATPARSKVGWEPFSARRTRRRAGWCADVLQSNKREPFGPQCQLLGVPIQPEDAGLLCVHFQPMNEHRDGAHGE